MALPSPFEFIPSQFHLASLFLIGIIGFIVIIRFKSVTAVANAEKPKKSPSKISTPSPTKSPAKELAGKFGSVETPGGRRSARIAHSASKKGH